MFVEVRLGRESQSASTACEFSDAIASNISSDVLLGTLMPANLIVPDYSLLMANRFATLERNAVDETPSKQVQWH